MDGSLRSPRKRSAAVLALMLAAGHAAAAEDEPVPQQRLAPLTIIGDAEREPPRGPGAERAPVTDPAGATRTVIDADELERRRPDRIEELTGRMPGAHTGREHGGLSTAVTLRGFDATTPSWNGLPDIDRLFVRDPYTVERVEVRSGPDGILEGVTAPGGSIRYHGKRPEYRAAHEVGVEAGYPDHRRVTADSTGPIGEDLAYRLVLAGQDGESRPAELETERVHGLAGLAWRYVEDGELRVEHEFQRNRRPYDFGTIYQEDGAVYDRVFHSPEQDSDRRYRRSAVYWDQELTGRLSAAASLAHAEVEREDLLVGFSTLPGESVPAPDELPGYAAQVDDDYNQTDARVQLDYTRADDRVQQRWVVGLDGQSREIDLERRQSYWTETGWTYLVDPEDPQASFRSISPENLDYEDFHDRPEEQALWGGYVATRLETEDRWQITAGARHNAFHLQEGDEEAPELETSAREQEVTWQAGIEVPVTERSEGILNAARGVTVNPSVGCDGRRLPLLESDLYEVGWRWSPSDRSRLQAKLFAVEQENVGRTDPECPHDASIPVGEREVEGGELRYRWYGAAWELDLNGTVQRSSSYGDDDHDGNHFEGVPRHLAGLSVRHDLGAYTPLPLELWYAGEYVGGWYLDAANEHRTDGYAVHDLGAAYRWEDGTRLDLRVRNAADERYLAAPRVQGERREVRLGLSKAF